MTEEVNTEPTVLVAVMSKWFGDFQALSDIDLTVDYGERAVICGPSGSGKSTLIRCHNQLEIHQKGTVIVNGTELSDNTKNIEDLRRNVGLVLQSFNSFLHLSVLGNCVLAERRVLKNANVVARGTAMKYLEQVKIPEQRHKFPRSAIRRPAATGCHCKGSLPGTQDRTADHEATDTVPDLGQSGFSHFLYGANPTRAKSIWFSSAYAPFLSGAFAATGMEISLPADLAAKKVGSRVEHCKT